VAAWQELHSDPDAHFNRVVRLTPQCSNRK